MPMTPNIIHTMKHTVKASVLTASTDQALGGMGAGAREAAAEGLEAMGRAPSLQ
jgi:hypothetical protein